jgi:hypothetical protein
MTAQMLLGAFYLNSKTASFELRMNEWLIESEKICPNEVDSMSIKCKAPERVRFWYSTFISELNQIILNNLNLSLFLFLKTFGKFDQKKLTTKTVRMYRNVR